MWDLSANDLVKISHFLPLLARPQKIEYILYEPDGCTVFSESVSTTASFNSKSDGYDFGNKASERMAIKRNIEYNVKKVYLFFPKKINKPPSDP